MCSEQAKQRVPMTLTLLVQNDDFESRLCLPFEQKQGAFHILSRLDMYTYLKHVIMQLYVRITGMLAYPSFIAFVEVVERYVTGGGQHL